VRGLLTNNEEKAVVNVEEEVDRRAGFVVKTIKTNDAGNEEEKDCIGILNTTVGVSTQRIL
jgi:hypothetical protein